MQMLRVLCDCMQKVRSVGLPVDIRIGMSLTASIRKARFHFLPRSPALPPTCEAVTPACRTLLSLEPRFVRIASLPWLHGSSCYKLSRWEDSDKL